jgi:DNA-binding CsgD family transcriptional regulator
MENLSIYEDQLITKRWPEFSTNPSCPENECAFLNDKYIQTWAAEYDELVVLILNQQTLEIVYVSPNVEKLTGHAPGETTGRGVWQWMENLPEKELLFQLQNNQFVNAYLSEKPHMFVRSFLINGVIKTKDKEKKKILCSNFTLDWNENGQQQHHLFLWIDATHIFKNGPPSWRHQFGKEHPAVWSYDTEEKEFKNADLFCSREREIIFLLSQEKSNEEIGDILHIKSSEVSAHIKKMVRRLQVKEVSGLLEIARWIRLL